MGFFLGHSVFSRHFMTYVLLLPLLIANVGL